MQKSRRNPADLATRPLWREIRCVVDRRTIRRASETPKSHLVQRAVRQPAEDLRAADRDFSGPDGRSQQLGWGHGQDDRRAKHRRRQYRDRMVWTRGPHLALRVLAQYCSGMPCGSDGVHASIRVPIHPAGESLRRQSNATSAAFRPGSVAASVGMRFEAENGIRHRPGTRQRVFE